MIIGLARFDGKNLKLDHDHDMKNNHFGSLSIDDYAKDGGPGDV